MSKLTPKFVKEVSDAGSYQDGRGLILRVSSKGRKSWVFRFSYQGKRHDLGVGTYPALPLRDARLAADGHRVTISQGKNPLEIRRAERSTSREKNRIGRTFRAEAQQYIKTHSQSWSADYADDWQASMTNHVYPRLGKLSPAAIDTDLVLSVLEPIWLEIPVTAQRVRNRIELVLDAAKAKGLREGENPARWRGHLDKLLPKQSKKKKSYPSYPWEKTPALLDQIASLDGNPARALELLILTGCRSNEVREAEWPEFDFGQRIWTVPGERMKSGVEHKVPLTDAMIGVLDSVKGLHSRWVFKNAWRSGPIPANSLGRVLESLGVRGVDAVPHGFRSTFRTWAADATNFSREVCELALAHTLPDKTEAAYNRAELLVKRRALMEAWSDYLVPKAEQQRAA